MNAVKKFLCLVLISFPFCAGLVAAAEDAARVEGRVTKGGVGFGAVIVLLHELKMTAVTDGNGRFAFESVPFGSYNLVLTLGDNTAIQALVVDASGTKQVEIVVDWDVRGYEEVTVSAVEMAAKIVDAPAAVTSIPLQQIEQQASQGQVPKILEFTPGAEVTQSGLYDFNFNTRGFNSSLNRRVSTYIDGRDVGVVLLGAQEWAAISGGLDDVANLEFIRGPSAALYGANASSGVVNITTKAPRKSLGGLVRLVAGELATKSLDARYAFELGHGWYGKVLGGLKESGDFTVSRNQYGLDGIRNTEDDIRQPEYPGSIWCEPYGKLPNFAQECLPYERTLLREQDNEIRHGALRFDKYLTDDSVLTFEAGSSVIKGPVFQTGIGRVQNLASKRPFFRFGYSNRHWNVLAHHTTRDGNQANLIYDLQSDFGLHTQDTRYGVEAQGNWEFLDRKLRFVIGAAHTAESVDTRDPSTGKQTVVYQPIRSDRQAVFTQLDWRANDRFKLVFAGRLDKSTLHDTQFSPKAAAVYSINPTNSFRLTYNRAFQVANYSEFFLHTKLSYFPIGGVVRQWCVEGLPEPIDCGIPEIDPATGRTTLAPILAVGNDDLKLEKTEAWEFGYSGLLASKVFVTVDYYRSKNKDFITDLLPQIGTILGNVDGCVPDPALDSSIVAELRKRCPINADYPLWTGPEEAETTLVGPNLTAAQAIRNQVQRSVGPNFYVDSDGTIRSNGLGFRLARDLNGDAVIVGRTYANIGLVNTQGVDVGVQYFMTPEWSLQFAYSWFDFEIAEAGDIQDLEDILLPNTPSHKVSAGLSLNRGPWSFSAAGRWVRAFRWSAGIFQGDVPDYTTVDLSAGWRVWDHVQVGFNVANARNSVHRQTFGGDLVRRRALLNVTFTW